MNLFHRKPKSAETRLEEAASTFAELNTAMEERAKWDLDFDDFVYRTRDKAAEAFELTHQIRVLLGHINEDGTPA